MQHSSFEQLNYIRAITQKYRGMYMYTSQKTLTAKLHLCTLGGIDVWD